MSYAHSRGVVHRDIKPENILLESGHAVVADFGIAKAITAAGSQRLTETGLAVGTPQYMSPEQAAGSRDLDGRSDLYALGCVLFEMLAGQPPFTGPTAESVVHQHLAAEPPSITGIRPAVPAAVAAALQRSLAKTPADRFNPVALFAEALGGRASAGTVSPLVPAVPVPARWSRRRVALVAVAAVAVLAAVFAMGRWVRPNSSASRHARTAIAVLPFENLSAVGPHTYFASGLHDELLTQLAKVAAVSVRARTSVMGYAGTTKSIREIGDERAVGALVEGSVQVEGNRLRVNVQLIDAATDEHLWAERYDRTLDDAFAIQSDVEQRIVAAVGATLGGTERTAIADAPTANAEAYRLYLQGREFWNRPGFLRQDVETAQQLLERALGLDPNFALAHANLSEVHGRMYLYRYDPSPTRAARQRDEAETALRLAPDLPQAHIAMGLVHYWGRRDYGRALAEFAIALKSLPTDAQLWFWMGAIRRRQGSWNEVFAAFEKATQLDPRNANLFFDLGGASYRFTHRYADAVRAYGRALSLAPDLDVAAVRKGQTYAVWQGQLDTLRVVLSRIPRDVELGDMGSVTAQRVSLLLWERDADGLLQEIQSARIAVFEGQFIFLPSALYAAWAYQLRGDRPASLAAFEAARVLLDSAARTLPDDWRIHSAHGLALAGLGRRDGALREARWLQRSDVYRGDAVDGAYVAEDRARILAQAGEADAALDEIQRLLAEPSLLSVHTLRLDPRWDPIRNDPRFQALLRR